MAKAQKQEQGRERLPVPLPDRYPSFAPTPKYNGLMPTIRGTLRRGERDLVRLKGGRGNGHRVGGALTSRPLVSLVDDDLSVRESLPDLLQELGCAVRAFSSADEFLCVRRARPHRLSDPRHSYPGHDGPRPSDRTDSSRAPGPNRQPSSRPVQKKRSGLASCENGAVAYLSKPFGDTALLDAIRAAIGPRLGRSANVTHTSKSKESDSAPVQGTPVVFVVDDDVSVRESLESMIRFAGWQVELFSSAEAFLAYPRLRLPSCLVLDVGLPGSQRS